MRALTFVALSGLLLLSATRDLDAQGTLRIGYIDSQAILQEAPGALQAQQEFERQMQRWQQEIEQMGVDLDSMIADYQQQQSTLLPNVRQARESAIQQQEQRYQQRLQQLEQEAANSRQQLIEPILMEMTETIEQMRMEGDYALILDVAGQSIIAADPSLDLTDEVLRRLEQSAGASSGAADAPSDDAPGNP